MQVNTDTFKCKLPVINLLISQYHRLMVKLDGLYLMNLTVVQINDQYNVF